MAADHASRCPSLSPANTDPKGVGGAALAVPGAVQGRCPLRILLLCHSFNSLSQRLYAELQAQGHTLSVELDIADSVTQEAVALFKPDLVLAPFLKRRIPATVWQAVTCLVVHPGPPGDQGPSALDWAVLRREAQWGVTVLQANADFDTGPVWAHAPFAMRAAPKGSLYRREVTEAAWAAVNQAVHQAMNLAFTLAAPRVARVSPPAIAAGATEATALPAAGGPVGLGSPVPYWQPAMRQSDRAIDWAHDDTATVLAKIRSADGQPGVLDALWGQACYVYDAHDATPATQATSAARAEWPELGEATPGQVVAVRDGALLRRTVDGAVWLGQVRLPASPQRSPTSQGDQGTPAPFKQVAAQVFAAQAAALPQRPAPLVRADGDWGELRYSEHGPEGARVGCLWFDFYNGAMSTGRCQRLLTALHTVRERPTRVLLLMGGRDFFSNGIDLNTIEAAAQLPGDSAADESWRNIQAMDDVAEALITTTDRLTISVLRGNAGAGGAFLALAADEVWAHAGVVLNPHYKNMGNLYGSEYWTYLLPKRLGAAGAQALMAKRQPLLASAAQRLGLVDWCDGAGRTGFGDRCLQRALGLAASYNLDDRLKRKVLDRAHDEAQRPLADYRTQELARMHRNFYGFDPSYHVARYHFVHKLPHAWTPRHLALHRP